jgi:hypothetical protein
VAQEDARMLLELSQLLQINDDPKKIKAKLSAANAEEVGMH